MSQPMSETREVTLKECFKFPFRYDNSGQIVFDADSQMVADIRAWGHLGPYENGEALQNELGEMIARGLNEQWNPHPGIEGV